MAKSNSIDAVQNQLGTPSGGTEETVRRPEKKTIVSTTLGDLSVYFGTIAWPDPDSGVYGKPTIQYFARVRGYKNTRGYDVEVPISASPEDIRSFARKLNGIADTIEKFDLSISSGHDVDNLSNAAEILGKE